MKNCEDQLLTLFQTALYSEKNYPGALFEKELPRNEITFFTRESPTPAALRRAAHEGGGEKPSGPPSADRGEITEQPRSGVGAKVSSTEHLSPRINLR